LGNNSGGPNKKSREKNRRIKISPPSDPCTREGGRGRKNKKSPKGYISRNPPVVKGGVDIE